MKNKLLSSFSYTSMMIIVILSSYLGVSSYSLIKLSGIDCWISVIISFILSLIILFLYIYISSYKPDLSLRDKIIDIYGKKIGFLFNSIICFIYLLIGINFMYDLNNFVVSQYLSETPLYIIGLSFSFLILYINIKNIETISRTTTILTYIIVTCFIISVINLIPQINIDNFKPILIDGIKNPIRGSLYLMSVNYTLMFLLLIIPKNKINNYKNYNKYTYTAYIISFIVLFILSITIIGNLGIYLASYYQYPEYMVLKKVSLFSFLNRLENVLTIIWIFSIFITLSLIVYFISNTIKYNNNNKFIPLSVISIILILSLFLFKNSTIYNNYNYHYTPYIRVLLIIIFIILSISICIKKRAISKK